MTAKKYLLTPLLILLLSACQIPSIKAQTAVPGQRSPRPKVPDPTVSVIAVSPQKGANSAVTFGQPFVSGDVAANETVQAITFGGRKLSTQVDWKTTNHDGSHRYGIVTIALPAGAVDKRTPVGLYTVPDAASHHLEPSVSPPPDFDSRVVLDIDGKTYAASFRKLFAAGADRVWLSGPQVTEWHVSGPVKDANNHAHDRLWVQFYVRHYAESGRTRVSVIVENSWTFKPNPRNITYDAQIFIDGQPVYSKRNLTHTDHARWRRLFWVGGDPQTYVQHDLNYLKATGAVPNYDPGLRVSRSAVAQLYKRYKASDREPMGISLVTNPMMQSGGRPDIGPLPIWTVMRLLTMDPRLIEVTEGIGESAGSWPIHLRDEDTGLPVSLADHPNLTTHINLLDWPKNPLPAASYGEYPNKLRADWIHQPSLAFIPYLLSGDYYYLEELQFWAAWNPLRTSPDYRGGAKGWFKWTQVRGQAWSLRTLGQLVYVMPDDHPMKRYWARQLDNNLKWYNAHYVNNPDANKLGFLVGYMPYNDGRGLAPWQDDFFTWAMGYLVNLGFDEARPMLDYKARFPVGRMTAPGYCWVLGAIYKLNVRDSEQSPFYDSFARAYNESVSPELAKTKCGSAKMASLLGKHYKPDDMSGYPWSPQGFPANMQPALAAAVDAGVPNAQKAWTVFMNRTTRPDYSSYPNWDIVPRRQ